MLANCMKFHEITSYKTPFLLLFLLIGIFSLARKGQSEDQEHSISCVLHGTSFKVLVIQNYEIAIHLSCD